MAQEKILVTGKNIEPDYNRTLIILRGLRKLGYDVIVFNFQKENKESAEQVQQLSENSLFTFLPSFSHKTVKFVKKNTSSPVVFDPLISKYMTNVKDYRKYPSFSYGALRTSYRDLSSTSRADFVVFDTKEHQKYFLNRYKIKKEKTGVVYVGANSHDFRRQPLPISSESFKVGFIGHFIPLHGIFNILGAALKLKNRTEIKFELIGTGFHFDKAKKYVEENEISNVQFLGQVKYEELQSYIRSFDLCLGIFSDNIKSYHVIPNKIFNYASCGKPILTMESPAIKEIFQHKKDIFLCPPNATGIADSIISLMKQKDLRIQLGENIHSTVNDAYNEEHIAESLIKQFKNYLKKK